MQGVALIADHNRMAGVIAALISVDKIHAVAEQVGGLALAFIAPLCSDDHDGGHVTGPSRNKTKPRRRQCTVASGAGALAIRCYRSAGAPAGGLVAGLSGHQAAQA